MPLDTGVFLPVVPADTTGSMALPVVAIVGRPNVGKSSLLNALVRRRIAIVDPTPGVTRDRISAPLPVGRGYVELLDTAGFLEPVQETADGIAKQVARQIEYALDAAAVVLFVTDAREGVTSLDRAVAQRLRRTDKPVLLVANKVDAPGQEAEVAPFHALGFGPPLAVSSAHRLGLEDLLLALREKVGQPADRPPDPQMKLAIVGRRNVGKSTFINTLAGQDRVIVSEVPGTTRDSVDVNVRVDGTDLLVIDTAGVRKRAKLADAVEAYGQHRTQRSIRRADAALMMIDAAEPIGMIEKQLAAYVAGEFTPAVLVVNKWDLAEGKAGQEQYGDYLDKHLPEVAYAPIAFTCARTGRGVREAVLLAGELITQSRQRVPTGQLNAAIGRVAQQRPPRAGRGGGGAKILYATQIATAPPTIVCFVNDLEAFDPPYQRYLLNQLRDLLPFAEIPIRLLFRRRTRDRAPRARA